MRRLANWALGGDGSSTSSTESDQDGEVDYPHHTSGCSEAFFSHSWRAVTPSPPPSMAVNQRAAPTAKSTARSLPADRTRRDDAVREYLDGLTAVPPEVELSGGPHDWLFASHDHVAEADVEAEAVLEAMVSRAKRMHWNPTNYGDGSPVEREVSMEAHFQNRLDELARQYRCATPVQSGEETRVDRGEATTGHEGVIDGRYHTPRLSSQTVARATTSAPVDKTSGGGNAFLWLVKAVFTRSSPTPAHTCSPSAEAAHNSAHATDKTKTGGVTPPLFELTLDPSHPTTTPATSNARTHPARLVPMPSTLPSVARPLFTTTSMTTTATTAVAFDTTVEVVTATGEQEEIERVTVLDELTHLADVPLPSSVALTHPAHTEEEGGVESLSQHTESAIRSRFNSLFATTTAPDTATAGSVFLLDTTQAQAPPPSVAFGSVTITSEEPDVAKQIARLSERYFPTA